MTAAVASAANAATAGRTAELRQYLAKPGEEAAIREAALDLHMTKPYFTRQVRGEADAAVVVPWTCLTLQIISPPASAAVEA